MKKYLSIIVILLSFSTFSQNSEKAKKYLDDVLKKVESYENISIEFKYSLINEEENISQSYKGNVFLKKEKYLVNLLGITNLFDGEKLYTINNEDEEVTITNSIDEENNINNPSKMLSFYKEGFTYIWDKELPISGKIIQFIKLIPIDTNSDDKQILLGIDSNTKNIYNTITTGKNGTETTLTVNSFKTNQSISESLFIFDKNKYSNYYFNE
jgi:outer membrane lipoprotein-sorting protein